MGMPPVPAQPSAALSPENQRNGLNMWFSKYLGIEKTPEIWEWPIYCTTSRQQRLWGYSFFMTVCSVSDQASCRFRSRGSMEPQWNGLCASQFVNSRVRVLDYLFKLYKQGLNLMLEVFDTIAEVLRHIPSCSMCRSVVPCARSPGKVVEGSQHPLEIIRICSTYNQK